MLPRRALAAGHFELNDWQDIPVTRHQFLPDEKDLIPNSALPRMAGEEELPPEYLTREKPACQRSSERARNVAATGDEL
jgi:hypothetical protein